MEKNELVEKVLKNPLYSSVAAFLIVRVCQRIYYLFRGHSHYWSYNPFDEMEKFLKAEGIPVTDHSFVCKRDAIRIRYRKLGNGPKVILLTNGVGTAFYMWLSVLRYCVRFCPSFFKEFTLIAPVYRGLFGSDAEPLEDSKVVKKAAKDGKTKPVEREVDITMNNCVEDIRELMQQIHVTKFHCIIGWSMGAQTALTLCTLHPEVADSLFLLNPSTGLSLHKVFQAIVPLPAPLGRVVSKGVRGLHSLLRPIIPTSVWDVLKVILYSPVFRGVLEVGAFFGGFPPEQPVYFHAYMKDVFGTRNQTRGLLDLIIALDSPCPEGALTLPHKATIVTGFPDIMTGVYHGWDLERGMKNSRHVVFNMGSHFVILEWPDLVAEEIIKLVRSGDTPQVSPLTKDSSDSTNKGKNSKKKKTK